jgi:hypothetical protein
MKTFRIKENPPYDKYAPNTYWIIEETKWFGITMSRKAIGDYKYDDTYGELGYMPFFDKNSTKKG